MGNDDFYSLHSFSQLYCCKFNPFMLLLDGFHEHRKDVGHFTQVVKDDAYKVGCSIAKFSNDGGDLKTLLACNYAVSNIKNWPIYEEGETASACETGKKRITINHIFGQTSNDYSKKKQKEK